MKKNKFNIIKVFVLTIFSVFLLTGCFDDVESSTFDKYNELNSNSQNENSSNVEKNDNDVASDDEDFNKNDENNKQDNTNKINSS